GKCHFKPDPLALRGFQGRERQEEIVPRIEDVDYLTFLRDGGFDHVRDPHGARSEMIYMPQVSQLPAGAHPSQWVGDRSIRFLETQTRGGPWLLFASFIHPHPPYAPPSPWDKLYRAVRMPPPHLPEGYASLQPFVPRSRLGHYYHDGPVHVNLWRTIRAFYYACVSFVDFQVGRIMQALERTGRLDDTLVVFTSDHGDMLGDYGLVGKSCMLDAAAKIPMVVRRPGAFDPGKRCGQVASLLDVGPTILRAAGIEPPPDWAGVDLKDLAAGKVDLAVVFSQVNQAAVASYMAVDERRKYVYSAPDRREYLFDRRDDPHETRDLAAAGAGGDEMRRLKAALLEHLRAGGEDAALDGDDWKTYPLGEVPDPETHRNIRDNPWADYRIPGYSDREGS
ncbi:MAG TPA: sulfatase-like hydrolase/transferase, partial [Phycisphaerae bacterium]|nr:sulfatase-like hydrolase/transferase [Phycisphaerae bacterium]